MSSNLNLKQFLKNSCIIVAKIGTKVHSVTTNTSKDKKWSYAVTIDVAFPFLNIDLFRVI